MINEDRVNEFQSFNEEDILEMKHPLTDDEMDALYAEYIMDHAGGERCIANGDDLLILMENGYLWDEFQEQYVRICASRR